MAPFGGYKRSGIGRESGQEAWIDTIGRTANPFILR
jgi:aldehyde dehydrogenase (NAD+)